MTPAFSSVVTEYTAATANEADKVIATATDDDAEIAILLGDTPVTNGENATWSEGENTLKITVSEYGGETEYTVTVTMAPGA